MATKLSFAIAFLLANVYGISSEPSLSNTTLPDDVKRGNGVDEFYVNDNDTVDIGQDFLKCNVTTKEDDEDEGNDTRALTGSGQTFVRPGVTSPKKKTIPPGSCGQTLNDPLQRLQLEDERIIGGERSAAGSIPWIVELSIARTDGKTYLCGGTLIRASDNVEETDIVITAAHCYGSSNVKAVAAKSKVLAGSIGPAQQNNNEAKVVAMSSFVPHEQFGKPAAAFNDIAIIKLAESVKFTDYIQPACLPQEGEIIGASTSPLFAGWGQTKENDVNSQSVNLMQVQLPVVDYAACVKVFPGLSNKAQICSGLTRGGKDTCQGDSGGPVLTKSGNKYVLQGVVSFGDGCAKAGTPGISTRVSNYIPWINQKIKELSRFANQQG